MNLGVGALLIGAGTTIDALPGLLLLMAGLVPLVLGIADVGFARRSPPGGDSGNRPPER
ncbi:MAG: hypothetical protein AB7G23_17150 [Vicinamibacterales bacterium]